VAGRREKKSKEAGHQQTSAQAVVLLFVRGGEGRERRKGMEARIE
jgi:hypothetical protein